MGIKNVTLLALFLTVLRSWECQLIPDSFQQWTQELSLETGMEVRWNSEDRYYLTMEISAPTAGYVAIGFSPSGGMKGSDIVLGWVDRDGIPYLVDFHAPKREQPIQDDQQDYDLVAASERDGRTTVRFRRRWDTCDEQHDMRIDDDTVRLIWAWHPSDPITVPALSFHWHGALTRGTRSTLLRSTRPNSVKFPDDFYRGVENVQQWDVAMSRVHIVQKTTAYMCRVFKFPRRERKYHLTGFRPLVKRENIEFVHHISLYTCHVPEHYGGTRRAFEKYLGTPERECSTPEMPPEWGTHCLNFLFVWALGSEGEMFPGHIGIPVGENSDDATYFKLEVHYNNPMGKSIMDNSGLRIFYTEKLRENDAGRLFLGHRVTPFQMIPPLQDKFTTHSFCSKECTRNGITSPDGMKITSTLLLAHLTGRKIMLRHIRDAKELPPISQDKNYDLNFQQFRRMKEEIRVLPGDELIVECDYDTGGKNVLTFGGLSKEREMCQAVVTYYPKTELRDCRSQPEFYSFFNALGMLNVSGDIFDKMSLPLNKFRPYVTVGSVDISQLDNSLQLAGAVEDNLENPFEMTRVSSPASAHNMSVGSYLGRMDWRNKGMVKRIQTAWRDGLHYVFCSTSGLRRIHIDEPTTHYPEFEPYREKRESDCRYDSTASHTSRSGILLTQILTATTTFIYLINLL